MSHSNSDDDAEKKEKKQERKSWKGSNPWEGLEESELPAAQKVPFTQSGGLKIQIDPPKAINDHVADHAKTLAHDLDLLDVEMERKRSSIIYKQAALARKQMEMEAMMSDLNKEQQELADLHAMSDKHRISIDQIDLAVKKQLQIVHDDEHRRVSLM